MGLDINIFPVRRSGKVIEKGCAYWRNAWPIFIWVCENVSRRAEEDEELEIPRQKLEELREDCKKVLKYRRAKYSNIFLPTGTREPSEYDDDYYNTIRYSVKELDRILNDPRNIRFIWLASW